VSAGANVLVFGRFEIAALSDSRSPVVRGLDYLMSAKSLKWRLPKRRRPSETIEGKKKERRNRGMARSAEFIHFRLGADTVCLDGTKIHANASRHSALSQGHIEKNIQACATQG